MFEISNQHRLGAFGFRPRSRVCIGGLGPIDLGPRIEDPRT